VVATVLTDSIDSAEAAAEVDTPHLVAVKVAVAEEATHHDLMVHLAAEAMVVVATAVAKEVTVVVHLVKVVAGTEVAAVDMAVDMGVTVKAAAATAAAAVMGEATVVEAMVVVAAMAEAVKVAVAVMAAARAVDTVVVHPVVVTTLLLRHILLLTAAPQPLEPMMTDLASTLRKVSVCP
jgi:hypothetical protein